MLFRSLPVYCLFIVQTTLYGAFEGLPISGKTSALAHATTAGDPASEQIFFNPAGIGSSVQCSMGQLFGLKDLRYMTLSAAMENRIGCMGAGFQMLGHPLYKEWQLLFALSRPVTETCRIGLCLHTMGLQIERYGSAATWQIDIGWRYDINNRLSSGGSITNISRQTIGQRKEKLPQISRFGFQFVPADQCRILVEVMKDARYPMEWKCAAACGIISEFELLCGFVQNPATITGGFALHLRKLSLEYGAMIHPVLGLTHTFTFGLR